MADRLEFRYSRSAQLRLLMVGVALVGGSLYVARSSEDVVYRGAGWFGAAFFTLCAIIAVKRLLGGGVSFVFELGGLAFPSAMAGIVPWSEIKEYDVVTVRGHEFLAFTFHDPARILQRVSAPKRLWAIQNQRLGWGHWALSFTGLAPGMNEALAFLRDHTVATQRTP
jgi:hypothetical protein